jgi:hypothetical protein
MFGFAEFRIPESSSTAAVVKSGGGGSKAGGAGKLAGMGLTAAQQTELRLITRLHSRLLLIEQLKSTLGSAHTSEHGKLSRRTSLACFGRRDWIDCAGLLAGEGCSSCR